MTPQQMEQALVRAVEAGRPATARRLLAAGVSPEALYHGEPVLMTAVDRGHHTIVELLIAAGAKVDCFDARYFSPLHVAIIKKRFHIAATLLAAGADINVQKNPGYSSTPLHTAVHCDAREGGTERTLFLLKNGVDLKREAYIGTGLLSRTGDALAQAQAVENGAALEKLLNDWPSLQLQLQQQERLRKAARDIAKRYRL